MRRSLDRCGIRLPIMAVVLTLALGLPAPARAGSLGFTVSQSLTSVGTISYAGGSAPLVGTGIEVTEVGGIGTPLNPAVVLTCMDCILSFTTGAFSFGSSAGFPDFWEFSSGGSISLTGKVPGAGITTVSTLLEGTFVGTPKAQDSNPTSTLSGGVEASFTDSKDNLLTGFFGLPASSLGTGYSGTFRIELAGGSGVAPAAFTAEASDGSITNTPIPRDQSDFVIPEPTTILLFGSGLVGLVGARLRRSRSG